MKINEFRKLVRETFPNVTISIKQVSFADLARGSAYCLTVRSKPGFPGARRESLAQINEWAKLAGVLPDGSI